MISVYLPAFYLGVSEELEKSALDHHPMNENILPTSARQLSWKYARHGENLKLSDGNLVYHFKGLPEHFSQEDHRVHRGEDDNILNFDKDAKHKGTAQIHRSSPDNIYMTLTDGKHNPTFMLQHEGGKQWRYTPSKKFVEKLKKMEGAKSTDSSSKPETQEESKTPYQNFTLLDPDSLFKGALEYIERK